MLNNTALQHLHQMAATVKASAQASGGDSLKPVAPLVQAPVEPTVGSGVIEVLGVKPNNVAISTDPQSGEKEYIHAGTEGSSRIRRRYDQAVQDGARALERTDITFKEGGRVKKMTVPNSDRDLGVMLADVFSSKLTAYELILQAMKARGWWITLDPHGSSVTSGHKIYRTTTPSPLPGVHYPESYRVLTPVRVTQLGEFSSVLRDTINSCLTTVVSMMDKVIGYEMKDEKTGLVTKQLRGNQDWHLELGKARGAKADDGEGDEDHYRRKAYQEILSVWGGFELFNKTAMQCGSTLAHDRHPYQRPINIDGGNIAATRSVPQLGWFDERLSEIEDEQLLSLLPPAEREVMMLFLGRLMLGREGTPFTNGGQQYLKWRSIVCFEGPQAGMGRTTLLDYLTRGLKICGYHSEAIDDLTGRFGHGRTAATDFGFIDDLSPEGTIAALKSALLKSVSAGGTIKSEEKGLMSVEVTSGGVYMLCTNQLDLAALATLDSGNLARLMPMRNACSNDKRALEYKTRYGVEVNTDLTYEHLSEKYDVPIETLVLLLLARSAEKYRAMMDKGSRYMIQELDRLKSNFVINTNMDFMDGLFNHYAQTMALQSPGGGTVPATFDIHAYLKSIIKLGQSETIPGCSDSGDLIFNYAKSALGNRSRGASTVTREFMSLLTSDQGLGYITDPGKINQLYKQKREHFDTTLLAATIQKALYNQSALRVEDNKIIARRNRLLIDQPSQQLEECKG